VSKYSTEESEIHNEIDFFCAVGKCITNLQNVEDFLLDIYAVALKVERNLGRILFEFYRGIDTKLEVLTQLIKFSHPLFLTEWSKLARRILAAHKNRSVIAHSNPVLVSGQILILRNDSDSIEFKDADEPEHFILVKKSKNQEVEWTLQKLSNEVQALRELYRDEISFCQKLKNTLQTAVIPAKAGTQL
jgi:hypothetical protein